MINGPIATPVAALLDGALALDERALRAELHRSSHDVGVDATVVDVVLPFLQEIGLAWERGTHTIANEHFASQIIRSWLTGDATHGGLEVAADRAPVVLACPRGERHDLGLLCFHVLLTRAGLPTRFLGSDTPLSGLATVCRLVHASGVVVAATRRRAFEAQGGALRVLARHYPIVIGGAGADPEIAERVHATALPADMRDSVRRVVDWHAEVTRAA